MKIQAALIHWSRGENLGLCWKFFWWRKQCSVRIVRDILDTGMQRLRESCENPESIQRIFAYQFLRITRVYTHLYEDDLTLPSNREAALTQGKAFYQAVDDLKHSGCQIPKVHILASSGLLQFQASQNTKIAVVAIGYGIPRGLSNGVGAALVQGCVAPIVTYLHGSNLAGCDRYTALI